MQLKTEILRGIKWTAGAKFSGQLITWGVTIYVMRLLSPSDYGLMAMASVLLAFLSMFSEVGLGAALVQQKDVSTTKMRQVFGIVLFVNILIFLILNLIAPWVGTFYAQPKLVDIVRILSIQFLLIPFCVFPEVLLQRQLEFKKRSLIDLGGAVLSSTATLFLALMDNGVWSLVFGNLIGQAGKLVALNVIAPFRELPSFSIKGMRDVLIFGRTVTASRFLWFFFTQADTVIIGRVLGETVLGMYAVAMHLATLPAQRVSAILNQVAFPVISRFQHDRDLIAFQLLKAFNLISFVAFPVLWGISSIAPELVVTVLGEKWVDAIVPLQILALVMPFRTLVGFMPTITDALGRPEVGLQNVLLGFLLMPPAFYIGAHWGITGVSLAWVCIYPIVLYINSKRMLNVIGLSVWAVMKKLSAPIMCAGGMYMTVAVTRMAMEMHVHTTTMLVTEIVLGGISYLLLSFAVNRHTLNEIMLMFGKKKPTRG